MVQYEHVSILDPMAFLGMLQVMGNTSVENQWPCLDSDNVKVTVGVHGTKGTYVARIPFRRFGTQIMEYRNLSKVATRQVHFLWKRDGSWSITTPGPAYEFIKELIPDLEAAYKSALEGGMPTWPEGLDTLRSKFRYPAFFVDSNKNVCWAASEKIEAANEGLTPEIQEKIHGLMYLAVAELEPFPETRRRCVFGLANLFGLDIAPEMRDILAEAEAEEFEIHTEESFSEKEEDEVLYPDVDDAGEFHVKAESKVKKEEEHLELAAKSKSKAKGKAVRFPRSEASSSSTGPEKVWKPRGSR